MLIQFAGQRKILHTRHLPARQTTHAHAAAIAPHHHIMYRAYKMMLRYVLCIQYFLSRFYDTVRARLYII
jgi:hypothetical protein